MSTPLAALIRSHIATHGPMPVEEFTGLALYHPQYGYYTNGYNFLPAPIANSLTPSALYPHDFTTAPEITPLFGATLANWVARQWLTLKSPSPFTLMECGPGRGILMRDMLTHLQTAHPACYSAARPLLVETSPTLTQLQKTTLTAFPQCHWDTTPTSNLPIILVANELLDAFPHTQLIQHEGRITPRTIATTNTGTFIFPQHGPITEHSPGMKTWLQTLPQNLSAALFADYGAATDGPTGDTLQAVYRHQKVDVFHKIGETDLTHHVNFAHVNAALAESHPHLESQPLEHLTPFLLNHGLASLALQIADADGTHSTHDTALHRLLHPTQMGTLFKVQCYTCTHP